MSPFQPGRVIQRIDDMKAVLAPEIQRHHNRWPESDSNWQQNVQILSEFANYRIAYLRAHLMTYFQLQEMVLNLNILPANSGNIKLNSLALSRFPWNGHYFKEIPIQIEAIPKDGFRFIGWSDIALGDSTKIIIIPSQDVAITAKFEKTSITDVEKNTDKINQFSLEQNYPNPFNFTTSIKYALPENCFVTITIFNLMGQKIATLVNQNMQAGKHQIEWNALAY
ncbi:MAG TPA: CotH kinase family protein, partial [bacterium]